MGGRRDVKESPLNKEVSAKEKKEIVSWEKKKKLFLRHYKKGGKKTRQRKEEKNGTMDVNGKKRKSKDGGTYGGKKEETRKRKKKKESRAYSLGRGVGREFWQTQGFGEKIEESHKKLLGQQGGRKISRLQKRLVEPLIQKRTG